MTTTQDRVREIIRSLDTRGNEKATQVRLAKAAGTSKAMVNHWLTGEVKKVSPRCAYRLQEHTGFRARWIMLGEGPKRIDKATRELIKLVDIMTPEQRQTFLRLGNSLVAKTEKELEPV